MLIPTRIHKLKGKSTRPGVYKCRECEKPFSVTVGTVFESQPRSRCTSGFTRRTCLRRQRKVSPAINSCECLGVSYKTAWFMSHRIREGMRPKDFPSMGGSGKIVEVDETYYGPTETPRISPQRKWRGPVTKGGNVGPANKRPIIALVERGGNVRTFHVPVADKRAVTQIARENIARESRLHTDESRLYVGSDEHFASHKTVKHSADEYVRGDVHTNTVEGFFSIFKRGMKGIYQHCSEKHLHRYLSEFDFRYSNRIALGVNDEARAEKALQGITGKRLTYRLPRRTQVN